MKLEERDWADYTLEDFRFTNSNWYPITEDSVNWHMAKNMNMDVECIYTAVLIETNEPVETLPQVGDSRWVNALGNGPAQELLSMVIKHKIKRAQEIRANELGPDAEALLADDET